MSTTIDTHDTTAELAQRTSDGFEILLLWDRGDGLLRIVVDDTRTGYAFELVVEDGSEALDAFYHPFAYAAARGIDLSGDEVVATQQGAAFSAREQ